MAGGCENLSGTDAEGIEARRGLRDGGTSAALKPYTGGHQIIPSIVTPYFYYKYVGTM